MKHLGSSEAAGGLSSSVRTPGRTKGSRMSSLIFCLATQVWFCCHSTLAVVSLCMHFVRSTTRWRYRANVSLLNVYEVADFFGFYFPSVTLKKLTAITGNDVTYYDDDEVQSVT